MHSLGAVPRRGAAHTCPDVARARVRLDRRPDVPVRPYAPLSSFQLDVGRDDYYGHSGTWHDLQDSLWLHLDRCQRHARPRCRPGRVNSNVPGHGLQRCLRDRVERRSKSCSRADSRLGQGSSRWSRRVHRAGDCAITLTHPATVTARLRAGPFPRSRVVDREGTVAARRGHRLPGRCARAVASKCPSCGDRRRAGGSARGAATVAGTQQTCSSGDGRASAARASS